MSKTEDERTNDELRRKIGLKTGYHITGTALPKDCLNSVYAYLNGEFYIHPSRVYNTSETTLEDLRVAVAIDGGAGPMYPREGGRAFNKSELQNIVYTMNETGDQRDWTG